MLYSTSCAIHQTGDDMEDETVVAAYSLPKSLKERVEQEARKSDLKTSQLVRRILREYFEALETEVAKSPAPLAA